MASKGLGRGLEALMSEIDENTEVYGNSATGDQAKENLESGNVNIPHPSKIPEGITIDDYGTLWVDPKLLKPNPRQPRQYFDEEELQELSESIAQDGVLQPITIEDAHDGTFIIIAGERRTRASIMAGLEKVPVQIKQFSEVKKLQVALIENIQRTNLNPIEEAMAYNALMEIANITQDEVAQRVGKKRSTIANTLRLTKLPDDMQKSLIDGTITPGHARAILSLDTPADQRVLYGKICSQNLSVRQSEATAKEIKNKSITPKFSDDTPKQDNRDPNYISMEQMFIEKLATKVQMKGDFNKGQIIINYFSSEDLDRIFDLITK